MSCIYCVSLRQILDVSVWSVKCVACTINSWCVVQSIQYVVWSVQIFFLVYLQVHVQCVMYTVQCAVWQKWWFSSWNSMSQIKVLPYKIISKPYSSSVFYSDGLRLYVFTNPKGETKCLIWLILITFFYSFRLTPPFGCKMFAKSTFLVIDMKSMCKHIPKVGGKHWFIDAHL